MTTGEKLMCKLESLGKTMKWLAEESGVGYTTVRRVASGDRVGYLDTWMRLAEALGCDLTELIGY